MKPVVSVIMAINGEAPWLRSAMESVEKQSLKNWELICVLDRVSRSVEKWVTETAATNQRVIVLKMDQDKGAAAARNLGLEFAQAEIIAILDCDDEWDVNHLENGYTCLIASPSIALVGCRYEKIDQHGFTIQKRVKVASKLLKYQMLIRNAFCHSSVMYRRAQALQIGGYPTGVSIGEDYCMWMKIAKLGQLINLTTNSVRYRLHSEQATTKPMDSESSKQILKHKLYLAQSLGIPKVPVRFVHKIRVDQRLSGE